jgi:acyl-CoA synthetase (AMP-forming)/AMP-acid ligase II
MSHHVGWLSTRAAQQWPARIFAHLGEEKLTFGELSAWVDSVAAAMLHAGVQKSDKVLVHLPNGFEVVVFQLAAWRIGAVAVPVVPIYRRRELSHIVGDVRPRVIVTAGGPVDARHAVMFDDLLDSHHQHDVTKWQVGDAAAGWAPAPPRPDGPCHIDLPDPAADDDCCLVLYTSGTTSAPKGVRLSSTALVEATRAWVGIGIDHRDVALAVAPLAHIAGLIPGALLPLTVGCPTVIMRRWDAREAVTLIDRHKATISAGAAVFLHDLVHEYQQLVADIHRLSHFVSGGAATPSALIRAAERVGMRASRAFGMTETAGVIAIAGPYAPLDRRANYDGCLIDSVQVRIVADGKPVARDSEGSLQIRGPQVLMGYTDPRRTEEQLRDGWFDPGDIARVTADGWLQIVGRTKDIINRGGEKFSARDIEEAILDHPDIKQVAVTAVPDQRFGEAVAAFVVLTDQRSWPGAERISAYLIDAGLAKAKVPVEWNVVDRIPVTATGKVQKHLLEELRSTAKEHS